MNYIIIIIKIINGKGGLEGKKVLTTKSVTFSFQNHKQITFTVTRFYNQN